ncbi:hypothetical protein ABTH65_19190, partial [Acinetobacter baumannii]
STNAGGLNEINIQDQTGYMANVGDVHAMSNFDIHFLKDNNRLSAVKEAAYQHALQFDIKHIVPVYEKLYGRFCRMEA